MAKEKKVSNEELFEEQRFDELYLNVIDLMRYKGNVYRKIDQDEKESIYNIAFTDTIRRFDLSKGVKFSTFLCLILISHLNKYVSRDREYLNSHLRVSLDASLDNDDEKFKLLDCIESSTYANPEDHSLYKEVLDSINTLLDERSAECLKLTIADVTQGDIAKKMGISQVQVSRIIKKARNIIKKNFDSNIPHNEANAQKPIVKEEAKSQLEKEDNKVLKKKCRKISRKKVGVKNMATKKDQCFELFNQGYHTNDVVKALAIPKNTVIAYKQMWQNSKNGPEQSLPNPVNSNQKEVVVETAEVTTPATEIVFKDVVEGILLNNDAATICTNENHSIVHKTRLVLIDDQKIYKGTFGVYRIINGRIIIENHLPSFTFTKEQFQIFYEEISELQRLTGQ